MTRKLATIVTLALAATGATAEQYTSSFVRKFAAAVFAEVRTEEQAYSLGSAAWFGDLCKYRYDILPSLAYFLEVELSDVEAFESGVPTNLLTRYHDGFYDTVNAYRAIKSKYPNDWGQAKMLACDTLHAVNPGLGTLK